MDGTTSSDYWRSWASKRRPKLKTRYQARREAAALRPAAERLVEQLWREKNDPAEGVEALRADRVPSEALPRRPCVPCWNGRARRMPLRAIRRIRPDASATKASPVLSPTTDAIKEGMPATWPPVDYRQQ